MNNLLNKAATWLNELGIRTTVSLTGLNVNRTDMAQFGDESTAADTILKEMKLALNTNKLFWGHKDDEWYFLQSF